MSEGCLALALVPMFMIGGIGALLVLVAVMLGIDVVAGWMVSVIEPLMVPPVVAMIGAALILFSAWTVFRLITGHAPPGTSARDMIVAVLVIVAVGVVGLAILLAAVGPQAADTLRF